MTEVPRESNVTPLARQAWLTGVELQVADVDPPIEAELAVTTNCELLIKLETGMTWRLRLDPAAAAYVAGRLAIASGVTFG